MKKILIYFYLLVFCFQVSATSPETMEPTYWIKLFIDRGDIKAHSDLVFEKPIVYNNDRNYINKIFLPKAEGSFPLVVVMPNCGAVDIHDRKFMEQALQRGYAAMVFDTHRGFKSNCPPQRQVQWGRMVKDNYDLTTFLTTQPSININRIYSVGGSEGGMIGAFLSSPGIKKFTAPNSPRFRANASFYGCAVFPNGTFANQTSDFPFMFNDTDRPLLWLIGDQDTECLIDEDIKIIKQFQNKKLPIEYHVYKDATHCWDCVSKNGYKKNMTYKGQTVPVVYKFDETITNESIKRTIDFFDKHK